MAALGQEIEANRMDMNHFIPNADDDKVFFYARHLVRHGAEWMLVVDANACLVSLVEAGTGYPTVSELRRSPMKKVVAPGRTTYEGRILFSAGVTLTINGKALMLLRDGDAPVDPSMWTGPAGRCDREPALTALKEFYEEVILFDRVSGRPIFVVLENGMYSVEARSIYRATLTRKGFGRSVEDWIFWDADVGRYGAHLEEVRTCFGPGAPADCSGGEVHSGRFWVFIDEETATLELRLLAGLTVSGEMEGRLAFCDGEYDRAVRLFEIDELLRMDKGSLVSAMDHFRRTILRS